MGGAVVPVLSTGASPYPGYIAVLAMHALEIAIQVEVIELLGSARRDFLAVFTGTYIEGVRY